MTQENRTKNAVKNHLKTLKKKHLVLKRRIEKERRRPAIDSLFLQGLKKEKLKLKEEISDREITA